MTARAEQDAVTVRFCRDCKWTERGADGTQSGTPYCLHAEAGGRRDLVTGKAKGTFCEIMRNTDHACGVDGALYSPRVIAETQAAAIARFAAMDEDDRRKP